MARPDFKAAFGAHAVPQLLDDLGEFAADCKGYFSGRFKLGPESAEQWTDPAKAKDFALFGRDHDGSLYGFWVYGELTPATAPIVYLDVNHQGSLVVASSLEEFVAMLAVDITDLGLYFDEETKPRKHTPGNVAFRAWLHDCFGMEPAKQLGRIVKRAGAGHPNPDKTYPRKVVAEA